MSKINQTIRTIQNLKSTRRINFTDRKIDEDKIDLIKKSILKTSNASNRQSYSIIILDEQKARELAFPGNKVFIYCIDFYRLKKCAENLGCEFDSQYFMQYSTALIDISLLVQSTVIASQSMGIDTLITNEIYHNKLEKTFELLKLPNEYVFPMIALCMGYSEEETVHKGRVDEDLVFFNNEYIKIEEKEINGIIEDTDYENTHIALMNTWKEMGFDHYMQCFFDK